MIPDYINCQNEEIEQCDYFWAKECPGTCELYNFLGIGAMTTTPKKLMGLEKEIEDGTRKV